MNHIGKISKRNTSSLIRRLLKLNGSGIRLHQAAHLLRSNCFVNKLCYFFVAVFANMLLASCNMETQINPASRAVLEISPDKIDFGPRLVNTTYEQTVTFKNSGNSAARDLSVALVGSSFQFKGAIYPGMGGTCKQSLGAGESCSVVVEYAPTDLAEHYMSLELSYLSFNEKVNQGLAAKGKGVSALADLSHLPAALSNVAELGITVGGSGIVAYRYKLSLRDDLDCAVETGYSLEKSIEEKIKDDLSGWSEKDLKICVIGKNDQGVWQEVSFPTEFAWYFDNTPPSVTIEQKADQVDPAKSLPIYFTVSLSEAIDEGTLSDSDIEFTGSGNANTFTLQKIDSTHYAIAVTGSSAGVLQPVIAAGKFKDLSGNQNLASTSVDNSVTYDNIAPLAASSLQWQETSPTNLETLTAKWNTSISTDVTQQKIRIYDTIACASLAIKEEVLDIDTDEYSVSVLSLFNKETANGKTFSYQIESVDEAGNAIAACSAGIILDYEAPTITLSGVPNGQAEGMTEGTSAKYLLNVTPGGAQVVAYKYKLGSAATTDCSVDTGYSTDEVDGSTKITNNISGYANGTLKVCAVGRDTAGNWQRFVDATAVTWTKVSPSIAFTLSSSSILEYDSPTHTVAVSITSKVDIDISVSYEFSGTGAYAALNGTDFKGASGTLTILKGTTSKTIAIPILDDNIDEYDESFKIDLSNPTGATLGSATSHTVTIEDDDDIPLLSVQDVFVIEGTSVQLRANISSPTEKGDVTLNWSVDSDCVGANCAIESTHYTINQTSGTATIPKGQTFVDFANVTTVDNATDESFKRIPIKLDSATDAKLYGTTADVYISDNDVPAGHDFVQVSMGENHTCGLTSGGKVYCGGINSSHQLGQGDHLPKIGFQEVTGFGGEAVQKISTIHNSICVLTKNSGAAYCWGLGQDASSAGFMGDGGLGSNSTPGPVKDPNGSDSLAGVSDIGIGASSGCALKNGAIYCWGAGKHYTLGRAPSEGDALTPVAIGAPLNSGVESLSMGMQHACVIKSEPGAKKVYCWGINDRGQLGRGHTSAGEFLPAEVPGITDAKNIWAGYANTCLQRTSGKVFCFGQNSENIIRATSGDAYTPVEVTELENAQWIELANNGICGLVSGQVRCRGINRNGGLGLNRADGLSQKEFATMVGAESQVTAMGLRSNNADTACFIRQGQMYCTGLGGVGQLGDGALSYISPPRKAALLSDENLPLQLSISEQHGCGIFPGGSVKCWGGNDFSRAGNLLNNGTYILPTPVKNLEAGVTKVVTNIFGSCALKDSGELLCWGTGATRGASTTSGNPVAPSGLDSGVQDVYAGRGQRMCAKKTNNIYCWGENSFGELGNGVTATSLIPVLAGTGAIKGGNGDQHICLLKSDKTVWCSGRNNAGQLGLGNTVNSKAFVQVPNLSNVKDLAVSSAGNCAHLENDEVWCWGQRAGRSGNQLSPVKVTELGTDTAKLFVDGVVACALLKDKRLKCWGANHYGHFGIDPSVEIVTPTDVGAFNSLGAIEDVSVSNHICVKVGTSWHCAGFNALSQLGLGTKPYRLAPISVNPLPL